MKKESVGSTNRDETTLARRRLLVEAAITCFVEQGIARTGMRDIAKRAGVSVGNLYNHFPGRDDLIAEIARIDAEGLDDVVEQVTACDEEQKGIETFIERYFFYCADPVSAVLTVEITSEALRNPSIENLFSGNRSMLKMTLAAHIAKGDDRDSYTENISELILDTIEGFALRIGLSGKKPRKRDAEILQSFVNSAISNDGK